MFAIFAAFVRLFFWYLLLFIVTVIGIEAFFGWIGALTQSDVLSVRFILSGAGVACALILVAAKRWGFVIAVAVLAFWPIVIIGVAGRTAINILFVAAAVLVAGAVVTIAKTFVRA